MGIESLTIVLDNLDGVFYTGQEVTGKVHITNLCNKILKEIYIEAQGHGKFSYSELSSETFSSREETYLNMKIPLVQNEDGNRFELASGVHQFPFSFVLPNNIPSSFQSEMMEKLGSGYVRYTIKAVLRKSSKQNNSEITCNLIPFTGALKSGKPDYEQTITFTVRSIVDLNTIPKAAVRTEAVRSKTVSRWGCCCCHSGQIAVKVWLDRTGYVSGETIYLHAYLQNQSHARILGSTVAFIESVDFHSQYKSKTYERVLYEQVYRDGDFRESPLVFPIVVPSVTPSYLQFCQIIDVSYKIEFRLIDSESTDSKLDIPLNILVGNVPLRSPTEITTQPQ